MEEEYVHERGNQTKRLVWCDNCGKMRPFHRHPIEECAACEHLATCEPVKPA